MLVRDENDHSPVFQKPEYTAIVSESVTQGTAIISLTATDGDFGLNAKIRYPITMFRYYNTKIRYIGKIRDYSTNIKYLTHRSCTWAHTKIGCNSTEIS